MTPAPSTKKMHIRSKRSSSIVFANNEQILRLATNHYNSQTYLECQTLSLTHALVPTWQNTEFTFPRKRVLDFMAQNSFRHRNILTFTSRTANHPISRMSWCKRSGSVCNTFRAWSWTMTPKWAQILTPQKDSQWRRNANFEWFGSKKAVLGLFQWSITHL